MPHIMFWRRQNLSKTVLPPYNSIAQRWMRGCPVNDISVGDVVEGDVNHRSIQRVAQPKALHGDNKYSKAKQEMGKIASVLSVQSSSTFKAALDILYGFAKALHEGRFAEFAAGFSPRELAVIKMEFDSTTTSTTTGETTTPSNNKASLSG